MQVSPADAECREINLLQRSHEECHSTVIAGLDQVEPEGSALIIADHDAKPAPGHGGCVSASSSKAMR